MPKPQRTFSDLSLEIAHDPMNRQSEIKRKGGSTEADFEMLRERLNDTLALRLLQGYRLGEETLYHFGLDDQTFKDSSLSSSIPTLAECMDRYTDEDLALLADYQKPTIIIRPPGKDSRALIGALAHHDPSVVRSGPVVREGSGMKWGVDMEYRPFIIEAVSNIQPKQDLLSQELGGRMWRHSQLVKAGEYAMTGDLYVLLAMQSIVRGQMIDRKTFTILNGDPVVAERYVPTGNCFGGQLSLDWMPCDSAEAVRGRFRRVLSGSRH